MAAGGVALGLGLFGCSGNGGFLLQTTSEPHSESCPAGETASFYADSDSKTAHVQWQVSTDQGKTWTDISGANSVQYEVVCTTAKNGSRYRAVFTEGAVSATSDTASLLVTAPLGSTTQTPTGTGSSETPAAPKITVQPTSNLTHCAVGQQILVSANATGFPPPMFQWQQASSPSGPFTDVVGASAMNYSFQCQSTIYMRVIASNSQGTVASQVIPINVS